MPDFGIGELIAAGAGAGDILGLGSIFGLGADAAVAAAPEIAAASVPLDIGAATGFGAAADAAAATAAGTGLASGLGETAALGALAGAPTAVGTIAETLGTGGGTDLGLATGFGSAADTAANTAGATGQASGLGSTAADAALPAASAPTAGTLTSDIAVPGVSGTGAIQTPASLTTTLGATPPASTGAVAPVGTTAATAPTDLASSSGAFGGTTGSTGASTGATGASDSGSILSKLSPSNLATGAVNQVAKNPLGTALGVGGLGYSLLKGNQPLAGQAQLSGQAAQLAAQAPGLMQYLQSGTLPPGMKAGVDQATQSAKAKIIANYAARGMPTDPTKNSALASELASVDQQAIITTAQLGQQLLTTGLDETRLSSDIYNKLVSIDQTNQSNISNALARFASGLGGGGVQLKLA